MPHIVTPENHLPGDAAGDVTVKPLYGPPLVVATATTAARASYYRHRRGHFQPDIQF